ncbi:folliculin-interacting protein 2-like [Amphibalanus amphitrite]|uniref:folliculin-interacting protein 2-like n=1 Tax=Amphibalanus amphitrite TaxID=1232801 RepID=UPI001C91498D|nr:folliculin-interacting protein 2-like [Amphibalanus amphitrite]
MALLSRLFGGRKKSALKPLKGYDNVPEFNPWQPVALEPDQVTVLVYRECEVRGRRLLFDSSTVLLVPCGSGTTEHAGLIEVENDTGFKYTRQRPDAKQLGEMVFGTVAMAYGGPTCKVHIVRGAEGADPSCSPDTMMMSRVFPLRQPVRRARTHGSSGTSLDDSCSSTGSELSLLRLDVAGLPSPHHPRSSSMDCPPPAGRLSEDSGLSSVDSFMGPPSYMPTPYGTPLSAQGSGASLGSHGSLHRSARLRPIGSSDLMLTSRDDAPCLRMTSRAARLAVVVLVTLAGPARSVLEDTLLQYSLQLEHLLARLQHTVERAYHGRRHFVRTVHQATAVTKQDLLNLLTARRLPRPVWLGLTSDSVTSRQRQRLAELFVSELTSLIAELDTKEHNCFMSTLLTAVLTHHLHWVLTVAPRGGGAGKLQPPPPARTLVVGRRTELVSRLLLVLSYFIRDQLVSETMPWSFSPLRAATSTLSTTGRDTSSGSLRVSEAPNGDLSTGSLRGSEDPCGGSLSSLQAAGRLSGSSATLRAEESGATLSPPLSAVSSQAQTRSRFYVRLDGAEDPPEPQQPLGRSRFYLPVSVASEESVTRADTDSGCGSADPPTSTEAPTVPALVVTDLSTSRGAGGGTLAPPITTVTQSRSCEPLCRPSAPLPPPSGRRLSRSSADLRAPVRFVVGGDEEPSEPTLDVTDAASNVPPVVTQRPTRPVVTSESSDDDSGFAGCERCSGRSAAVEIPPPLPAAGGNHSPLSRRHSDSIRDTSQYLRGYRSLRFAQQSAGWAARKARHVSDGGSPSPPPEPPPPPPPSPPPREVPSPAVGRLCRCLERTPESPVRLQQQTALLESRRGGPGRQSLTPWSALGGGGSTYVPDLALWGCDTRAAWESRLRPDLAAAASSGEVSCVLADTDSYSVQVLSSHAFAVCDAGGGLSGLAVVFAPLVSALVESVCRVHETGAPAPLVLRHLESQLVQLTARAAEMAQFLINSSLANMQELTELMSVDSNDVPLLLSAASVLCPEVGSKYGISVR